MRGCCCLGIALFLVLTTDAQQPSKLKTAVINWIADGPVLVYDVHFTGVETMPTSLKTLLKDIAENEGFYLTGEDKSKTVSSQSKRISIEYVPTKSRYRPVRIGKVEVKETPATVECTVAFSKKPSETDLTKVDAILETFARKFRKATKSVTSSVKHTEGSQPTVWAFAISFKEPPPKAKK